MLYLNTSQLHEAAELLRNGGILTIPTETVYGLAALWSDQAARERIYQLKHRPADKHLQMLAPDLSTAEQAGLLPDIRLKKLAKHFWPGALTVVAPARNQQTIGLRIPAHSYVLQLLQYLGVPLACTSANLSGHAPGCTVDEAIRELDGTPDGVVDGGKVSVTDGMSSTVVSLIGKTPVILREGPISLQDIMETLL